MKKKKRQPQRKGGLKRPASHSGKRWFLDWGSTGSRGVEKGERYMVEIADKFHAVVVEDWTRREHLGKWLVQM